MPLLIGFKDKSNMDTHFFMLPVDSTVPLTLAYSLVNCRWGIRPHYNFSVPFQLSLMFPGSSMSLDSSITYRLLSTSRMERMETWLTYTERQRNSGKKVGPRLPWREKWAPPHCPRQTCHFAERNLSTPPVNTIPGVWDLRGPCPGILALHSCLGCNIRVLKLLLSKGQF